MKIKHELINWINHINKEKDNIIRSIHDLSDGKCLLSLLIFNLTARVLGKSLNTIISKEFVDEFTELIFQADQVLNIKEKYLEEQIIRNKNEKFDIIYMILNLGLENFKEEKKFLQETFIKRNISEELFLINLCGLLKHINNVFGKITSPRNNNREFNLQNSDEFKFTNKNLFIVSPHKFNLTSNETINSYTMTETKCLNNKKNQFRNDLIIRSSRGVSQNFGLTNDTEDIFQNYVKFLKPTCPVIDCSVSNELFSKYIFKKEETKESRINSDFNKSEINYEYNIKKFTSTNLFEWLTKCYILRQNEISKTSLDDIVYLCKNGVLLGDLINTLEGRVINKLFIFVLLA